MAEKLRKSGELRVRIGPASRRLVCVSSSWHLVPVLLTYATLLSAGTEAVMTAQDKQHVKVHIR